VRGFFNPCAALQRDLTFSKIAFKWWINFLWLCYITEDVTPSGEALHKAVRAVAAPAFGPKAMSRLSREFVRGSDGAVQLFHQLCAVAGGDGGVEVEMLRVTSAATLDTIGHVAFATSLGQTANLTAMSYSDLRDESGPGSDWLTASESLPFEDVAGMLADLSATFVFLFFGAKLPPLLYRALPQRAVFLSALDRFDAVIARVVRERLEEGLDPNHDVDFLGLTLAHQATLGLTDHQLRDQVATMFVAGSDTTATSVSWTLHHLAREPEWQRRCREEVLAALGCADWRVAATSEAGAPDALRRTPTLRACIDETMRLHPPVARLPARVAVRDVVLPDDTAVNAGASIAVDVFSMQRHPRLWRDANSWWPGRWLDEESPPGGGPLSSDSSSSTSPCPFTPSSPLSAPSAPSPSSAPSPTPSSPAADNKSAAAFMPFGGGARACLGRGFAYAEAHVLLAALLCEFDMAPVEGHIPQEVGLVTLTSANGLPVGLSYFLSLPPGVSGKKKEKKPPPGVMAVII
jgi:cytochrome P450